jgi:3-hydroxyisobutyrate dehydrogenase-like beta-hydroxyacid dehydrogenase
MTAAIGIIGLGNAGAALAHGFSGQRPLMGHDRYAARADAVADCKLEWMASPAEVAEKAETVLLSLPHPEASRDVMAALSAAARPPKMVIETSTITPKTARELGAMCKEMGAGFVDAAIAGGVQTMAEGKVTFLVGGEAQDFERARPILELVSEKIHHLGPVGAGSGIKVVNNAVMHAFMVVLIEAGAMAKKLEVPMPKLVEILSRPDGVMRPLDHRFRERVLNGDFEGGMSVANARKDSVLALETSQDTGVPLFATLAAHTPYDIADQMGLGALDYAALAKLWEGWCDIDFSEE